MPPHQSPEITLQEATVSHAHTTRRVPLDSRQIGRLQDGLLAAFKLDDLRQMLLMELNVNLDEIVAVHGRNYRDVTLDVVLWAVHKENVGAQALLAAARRKSPRNPELIALGRDWKSVVFILPQCPYPGMKPFQADGFHPFYGRNREILQALDSLDRYPFLIVIGPSGSGKSSLLAVGIVPELKSRHNLRSEDVLFMRPGVCPFSTLANALNAPDSSTGETVARIEHLASTSPANRLLLVVDQFEEIFTTSDPGERRAFNEILSELIALQCVYVLIAARADFYSQLMASPLWPHIPHHRHEITPLRAGALREAIAMPARDVNVELEPALVQRLLDDAGNEPGVLPFVQETLVMLWKGAKPPRISLEAYTDLVGDKDGRSGLQVAMASHAKYVYNDILKTSSQRDIARRIFLQLIQFGEGRADTRRQQTTQEIRAHLGEPAELDTVVAVLTENRLLTLSDEEQRVDLSHEALIQGWPQLREWIETNRSDLIAHRQLSSAVQEWENSGRSKDTLYRGLRLANAEALANRITLTGREQEFLALSHKVETGERRRQRLYLSILPVLLVILAFAIWALWNARVADLARAVAQQAQTRAEKLFQENRALGYAAQAAVEQSPRRALLIAVEALAAQPGSAGSPNPVLEQTLRDLLGEIGGVPFAVAGSEVTDAKVSPDGHWLATLKDNGHVMLWNVETLTPIQTPLQHESASISAISFNADGQVLATGDDAGSVHLWNMNVITSSAPQLLNVLQGVSGRLRDLAFSPDGSLLAAASSDGNSGIIRLWRANKSTDQARILQLPGILQFDHRNIPIDIMTFSPNGEWLAVGENLGDSVTNRTLVQVWNVGSLDSDPKPLDLTPIRGNDERILGLAFSPDGSRLVASNGYSVQLWDIADDGQFSAPRILGTQGQWILTLAISPDGRWLASAGIDAEVWLWDLSAPDPASTLMSLRGHTAKVNTAMFSADGSWLVTTSEDTTVRLWDISDVHIPSIALRGHEAQVLSAVFDRTQRWLVSVDASGQGRLWLMPESAARRDLTRSHPIGAGIVARSPTGKWVAVAQGSNIELWNSSQPLIPVVLRGHRQELVKLAFSPDDHWLASEDQGGGNGFWDLTQPTPVGFVSSQAGRPSPEFPIVFSANSKYLASPNWDGTELWELTHQEWQPIILQHTDAVRSVAFNRNSTYLMSSGFDSQGPNAFVWNLTASDPSTNPIVLRGHQSDIREVAISSDGRWAATAGWDNKTLLWDLKSQNRDKPTKELLFSDRASAVAFSPDDRWLVTTSADGSLYVVDMNAPNQEYSPIYGHRGRILQLEFRRDGQRFITIGEDQTTKVWNPFDMRALPVILRNDAFDVGAVAFSPDPTSSYWALTPQALVKIACRTAGSNLSAEEWTRYFPGTGYRATCSDFDLNQVISRHLLDIGTDVIHSEQNLAEAEAKFRLAIERDTQLQFDPAAEAKNILSKKWLDEGNELVRAAKFDKALSRFGDAVDLASGSNVDQETLAKQLALNSLMDYASELVDSSRITATIAAMAQARELSSTLEYTSALTAVQWNHLCWDGSLSGLATEVLFACEAAVQLAPEDGSIRDSRALARALTGDIKGAIDDLSIAINWAKSIGYSNDFIESRQLILDALEAGNIQLDAQLLDLWRTE